MPLSHDEQMETLKWVLEQATKLEKIENIIRHCHDSLDRGKNFTVAHDVAFNRICDVLDMHYIPNQKVKK